MALVVHFLTEERAYTGRELRSHLALDEFGIVGDSAVAWIGACRVERGDLVDLVDARAGAIISSPRMLHLIVEHFHVSLLEAVLRQRLLARLAADLLRESGVANLRVRGNDIFVADRKANVSVATSSAVSALVHFGINVRTEGTPVPTWGLGEAKIGEEKFARELLARYAAEIDDVHRAAAKVRGVP